MSQNEKGQVSSTQGEGRERPRRGEQGWNAPLELLFEKGSSGSTVDGSLSLLLGSVLDQGVSLRRKDGEKKEVEVSFVWRSTWALVELRREGTRVLAAK